MMAKKKKYAPSPKVFAGGMEVLTDDAVLTLAKLVAWQGLESYHCTAQLKNDKGKVEREFCVTVARIK